MTHGVDDLIGEIAGGRFGFAIKNKLCAKDETGAANVADDLMLVLQLG